MYRSWCMELLRLIERKFRNRFFVASLCALVAFSVQAESLEIYGTPFDAEVTVVDGSSSKVVIAGDERIVPKEKVAQFVVERSLASAHQYSADQLHSLILNALQASDQESAFFALRAMLLRATQQPIFEWTLAYLSLPPGASQARGKESGAAARMVS